MNRWSGTGGVTKKGMGFLGEGGLCGERLVTTGVERLKRFYTGAIVDSLAAAGVNT
jgi:hypothetical protein